MDETFDTLNGTFVKTIFKTNSYMVARFETDDSTITVTGPFYEYEDNKKYTITGNYVDHPKFGFQFNILTITELLPTKMDEIITFLSSDLFTGIGKKTAAKIYDYFGDDVLNILKEDPEAIREVNLTDRQLINIIEGFSNLTKPENEILFYLLSNGFNNLDAQKIFARFKLATIEVGNDNPFRFYNEVYGMSFNKVKEYARKVEFSDSDIKFRESLIIYVLTELTFNSGDTYTAKDALFKKLSTLDKSENFFPAFERAIDNNYIVVEDDNVYLSDDYNNELFIANSLLNFKSDFNIEKDRVLDYISMDENESGIKYDDKQIDAIVRFFSNNISIINGGPGTGKTTIIKTISSIFSDAFPYNNMIVVAPTGRAAKRINEICEVETKTIHSLLRWNKETNEFIFNADNPILYDCIIIDEFSMVDNDLFTSLLKASNQVKKICFIGDSNQLPSIRPGNLLMDLLESNKFVSTLLTYNFRQSSGSEIVTLAKDIINNDVDLNRFSNDIIYIDSIEEKNLDIISMVKKDILSGESLDDIQILAPMYRGFYGIDNMNISMQSAFNKASYDKKEKKIGKFIFRENDKVLQLKNRPSEDVFNGDIGILENIDEIDKSILINYQGTYVFYTYDEMQDVSLAYAISVHKSQGSEYQNVYLLVSRANMHMLNKKLIYTAISRAKKKLVIISEGNAFLQGLKQEFKERNTTLLKRLT